MLLKALGRWRWLLRASGKCKMLQLPEGDGTHPLRTHASRPPAPTLRQHGKKIPRETPDSVCVCVCNSSFFFPTYDLLSLENFRKGGDQPRPVGVPRTQDVNSK